MEEKLLSMLGIARRAGRLALGFDAAAESMQKGTAYLLVLASDVSERTDRSICRIAEESKVPVLRSGFDMDRIGRAVGHKRTGVIAINDSGFAKTMKAIGTENSQEECI